jgi:hypothetical protein
VPGTSFSQISKAQKIVKKKINVKKKKKKRKKNIKKMKK